MKLETTRCDLCGRVCSNRNISVSDKDYCFDCVKGSGLSLWLTEEIRVQ